MSAEICPKGYVRFSKEILNDWRRHGISFIDLVVLDSENPLRAVIELMPCDFSDWRLGAISIDDDELMRFARGETTVTYLVRSVLFESKF